MVDPNCYLCHGMGEAYYPTYNYPFDPWKSFCIECNSPISKEDMDTLINMIVGE